MGARRGSPIHRRVHGGMGLGSVLWGRSRRRSEFPSALTAAAAGMVAAIALTWRFKLGHQPDARLHAVVAWAPPVLAENPEPESRPGHGDDSSTGSTPQARRVHFRQCRKCAKCGGATVYYGALSRLRQSAHFRGDIMDNRGSEHLRLHERVSVADREIQRRAKQSDRGLTRWKSKQLARGSANRRRSCAPHGVCRNIEPATADRRVGPSRSSSPGFARPLARRAGPTKAGRPAQGVKRERDLRRRDGLRSVGGAKRGSTNHGSLKSRPRSTSSACSAGEHTGFLYGMGLTAASPMTSPEAHRA